MKGYADLHTHTQASDGLHTPADNVRMASRAKLSAIAITDHDTVSGIPEAIEEGKKLAIEVVPGVEISTQLDGQEIHMLGYFIDVNDPQLLARLDSQRQFRMNRNEMMLKKLRQLGMDVYEEELLAQRQDRNETIGRPHIAELLLRKGYVQSIQEAFTRYIGSEGLAYVNPPRINPKEAVNWIREAGGAVVIAHPGLYKNDELVEEVIRMGVDGLEAYHSEHSSEDCIRYKQMAEQFDLCVTAGSDFHGERGGQMYHAAIGSCTIEIEVLGQLQQRKGR